MKTKLFLIASFAMLCFTSQAQTISSKRGFGGNLEDMADLQAAAPYGWYYNWGQQPGDGVINQDIDNYIEYVPMVWGAGFDQQALINYLTAHPEVKYILGFNEPNFIEQSNLTPTQAAAAWPQIEAIADQFNLTIVGPALNYCWSGGAVTENGVEYTDPVKWYDDFFAACPDCRVDHIAIHGYFDNAAALPWYIGLFAKYNKPIWLTEFNQSASWVTMETQMQYMTEAIDYLENEPMVFRYAWFLARSSQLNTNLFENGTTGVLTDLGQLYTTLPGEALRGYTFACDEAGTVSVTGTKDIAYGANGQYVYLYNQTADIGCNTNSFGSDPIFGTAKHCYTRPSGPAGYSYSCKENQTIDVTGTMDIAFGANGQYYYLYNQTADCGCNSTVFGGDPAFGSEKVCFTKPSPDTEAPAKPASLKATATASTINLTWTASTDNVGVTGYKLYKNGTYTGSTTSTSYSFTGLSRRTNYNVGVSAYDNAGNESAIASLTIKTSSKSATGGLDIAKADFQLYPNPAGNYTILKGLDENENRINLYDLTGKLYQSMLSNSDELNIDLTNLENGIYIIEVVSGDSQSYLKLIRE